MKRKNKDAEKLIVEKFEEEIKKANIQGMSVGAKTIATVVGGMIVDVNDSTSKNELLRRINKIKEFCETTVNNTLSN